MSEVNILLKIINVIRYQGLPFILCMTVAHPAENIIKSAKNVLMWLFHKFLNFFIIYIFIHNCIYILSFDQKIVLCNGSFFRYVALFPSDSLIISKDAVSIVFTICGMLFLYFVLSIYSCVYVIFEFI